jgi:hypothetical protein
MKKLMLLSLAAFFISGIAESSTFILEIKAGYFTPSDRAFKDIYGAGMTYGAEASIVLWRSIEMWLGGRYYQKMGKLSFTREDTELSIIPLGGGLQYRLSRGRLSFYVGAGLSYYLYKESSLIGEAKKGGLGYGAKVGGCLHVIKGLLVEIFGEYSYCRMNPADFEINIGGIEAGLGLGYRF